MTRTDAGRQLLVALSLTGALAWRVGAVATTRAAVFVTLAHTGTVIRRVAAPRASRGSESPAAVRRTPERGAASRDTVGVAATHHFDTEAGCGLIGDDGRHQIYREPIGTAPGGLETIVIARPEQRILTCKAGLIHWSHLLDPELAGSVRQPNAITNGKALQAVLYINHSCGSGSVFVISVTWQRRDHLHPWGVGVDRNLDWCNRDKQHSVPGRIDCVTVGPAFQAVETLD